MRFIPLEVEISLQYSPQHLALFPAKVPATPRSHAHPTQDTCVPNSVREHAQKKGNTTTPAPQNLCRNANFRSGIAACWTAGCSTAVLLRLLSAPRGAVQRRGMASVWRVLRSSARKIQCILVHCLQGKASSESCMRGVVPLHMAAWDAAVPHGPLALVQLVLDLEGRHGAGSVLLLAPGRFWAARVASPLRQETATPRSAPAETNFE